MYLKFGAYQPIPGSIPIDPDSFNLTETSLEDENSFTDMPINGINIISWNINSLMPNVNKLLKILNTKTIDVILIQEAKVTKKLRNHLDFYFGDHYSIYCHFPSEGKSTFKRHGLITLVKRTIPSKYVKPLYQEPVESLIVTITDPDKNEFEIQNMYISPSRQWDPTIIKHEPDSFMILAGDFNAHNKQWNNRYENPRGIDLHEAVIDADCAVVNTHTISTTHNTNIDLCIADLDALPLIYIIILVAHLYVCLFVCLSVCMSANSSEVLGPIYFIFLGKCSAHARV